MTRRMYLWLHSKLEFHWSQALISPLFINLIRTHLCWISLFLLISNWLLVFSSFSFIFPVILVNVRSVILLHWPKIFTSDVPHSLEHWSCCACGWAHNTCSANRDDPPIVIFYDKFPVQLARLLVRGWTHKTSDSDVWRRQNLTSKDDPLSMGILEPDDYLSWLFGNVFTDNQRGCHDTTVTIIQRNYKFCRSGNFRLFRFSRICDFGTLHEV